MNISLLRLLNQQVFSPRFTKPADLVKWMGAVQAQDYYASLWAVGQRIKEATELTVQKSLDKGEILRTHVLRPTWHLVPAKDIGWMIALTAPQILTLMKSRHRQLGLSAAIINKSNKIFEDTLKGGNHCTREELIALLAKEKIRNEDNRASHLFAVAELEGLICSGKTRGIKQTFALLSERVPTATVLSREKSMALLAERYFTSHGPATIQDYAWWSGLSMKASRESLEMIQRGLQSEKLGKDMFWFKEINTPQLPEQSVFLLPAYDEFLISYKSRDFSVPAGKAGMMVSTGGIFKSLIVVDGQVAGLWKRTKKSNKVLLELEYFKRPDTHIKARVREEAMRYGQFLGLDVEMI